MEGHPVKQAGQPIDLQRVIRLSEASDWLLRLQAPGRTEAEYDDWLRWCDAHPENFAAFESLQGTWNDLDALKPSFDATVTSVSAAVLPKVADRRSWRWAAAAGIAVIGLSIGLVQYVNKQPQLVEPSDEATFANRAATLPDGTKMILGAQSLVNMDFNGARRQLDLSSGEAYFKVQHDRTRPFIVLAGAVRVTAVGTAFDVRRNRDKVTVTVEEGTVEVRGASPDGQDAIWRAEAGHQLIYSTERRTASLASVDPLIALGWRNGELAYVHEPLGSVIEDLNRYSERKIRIADDAVAEIPFTGTAFAASLDGWLAGIQQAYPVDVDELTNGEIVLRSRQ